MIRDSLLALIVVLIQCATGAYAWQLIRRGKATLVESLGAGLALGTATSAFAGVMLWNWLPVWGWLVPTFAMMLAAVVLRLRRGNFFATAPTSLSFRQWLRIDRPSWIAIVIALGLGLLALAANMRSYPLQWSGLLNTYHPDMLFFEGLSSSLAHYGPNNSIFMAGADIRYHWLTYAWSGQLSQTIGAQPFFVLTRALPITALLGSVLLSIAWTRRLTVYRWAPTIAAVLVVSGGYVGATYGTILNFDSPSQQMATVWVLALSLSFWQLVSGKSSRVLPLLLIVFVLSAASTLGKVSTGIVALAAWGFVCLVAAIRREEWAVRAWLGLVAAGLGAIWVFFDFIAGSAEGGGLGLGSLLNKASSVQGLNPNDYWWGILAGTCLLILAMSARWVGLLWLVLAPSTRWQPVTTYGVGLVVISVATVLLISGGLNDTWFALAASAPLSVISAVGVARGIRAVDARRSWVPSAPVLVAVVCGVALSACVVFVWSLTAGSALNVRWAAPLIGLIGATAIAFLIVNLSHTSLAGSWHARVIAIAAAVLTLMAADARLLGVVSPSFGVQQAGGLRPTEFKPVEAFLQAQDLTPITQWSDLERDAGLWLTSHSESSELVATNMTYSPLVPALSARQTLISGLQYQAPYGRKLLLTEVLARESASLKFINEPSRESFGILCSYGVVWVWVNPHRSAVQSWKPFADVQFANSDVALLRLNSSVC